MRVKAVLAREVSSLFNQDKDSQKQKLQACWRMSLRNPLKEIYVRGGSIFRNKGLWEKGANGFFESVLYSLFSTSNKFRI